MYNTKGELLCTLWALGDDNVPMQVHDCVYCTTLVRDARNGELYACVGQKVYEKYLTLYSVWL